jgi:hypothetical protein
VIGGYQLLHLLLSSPPLGGASLTSDSIVDSLLDRDQRGWNVDLIRSIFSIEEAKVITNIPICPSFPPNRLVLQGTSNGTFSVCSAYHLGKEIQKYNLGECSSPATKSKVWNVIWSLRVPNPVKVFHVESMPQYPFNKREFI